jgi:hypothetical protein
VRYGHHNERPKHFYGGMMQLSREYAGIDDDSGIGLDYKVVDARGLMAVVKTLEPPILPAADTTSLQLRAITLQLSVMAEQIAEMHAYITRERWWRKLYRRVVAWAGRKV